MNHLSSRLQIVLTGLSIPVLMFMVTVPAGAETVKTAPVVKDSPFCTNLLTTIAKVNSEITTLESKLTSSRTERDQQLATNQAKWDQELAANRTKWSQDRQADFTKLQAKATTDTQKTAVATYETTIMSAISTRESANDTARATFRAGLANALSSQRSTIDSQVATFTAAVNSAEATAQASCQATPNEGPTIRASFVASMKSARKAYTGDRKADGNITLQVQQLAATRDAGIKANDTTFQTTAKTAETTLKAAFGSSSI